MNATQVGTVKQILEELKSHYDYIIIDTPPSEGYLTINSLVAADEVVIPLQAHFLAMQGLQQALDTIAKVQKGLNPNLKIVGILPTMVNPRTNIARIVLREVGERYSELLLPYSITTASSTPKPPWPVCQLYFTTPNITAVRIIKN